MEHAFRNITAILVSAAMFCVVPLMINLQRQENLIQLTIMEETVEFVDTARNMGMITPEVYENYQKRISNYKSGLEITMLHTTKTMTWANGIQVVETVYAKGDILRALEEKKVYYFQKGDYFRVEIKTSHKGMLDNLYRILGIFEKDTTDTYVYYGGSIRYEGE